MKWARENGKEGAFQDHCKTKVRGRGPGGNISIKVREGAGGQCFYQGEGEGARGAMW